MSISRRHFIQSALAGGAVLTLPEVFAQDIESTMARIKRTGKLRLGAINGATPYFNKDLVTQEWKGFCADFGRDLAKHLKAEVEWVETTWGNAVLDVQTNKIDAQLAMAPTPQRREVVDFSNPLYNNINTVVARKGLEFKTWEELNRPEIKVAVDVGSSHDQLVTRILPKATILRFETSAAATMALQSGRADCQVLVVLLSTSLLVKLPNIGHIVFPTPDETAPTNVGIRKQADQGFVTAVNGWLEEARKAGRIREIIVSNMESLAKVPATAFPPQLKF
ncbi:transporter substrate-binding domain-containing protein [Herbaspirillum frisingense]|uniref:transporter substrate-binding domain-containing protein n=1 Tax=Herbaspirillum frisingense TaxID=92645 RepID=UPI001601DE99|nr:transporter substrate-binding domain-containing protein [Herbaspirillum frisingense]QNB05547.1 transporter substrate-binding domain-containing protein [Herbaspirillum frisingense]